ncbi:MAG TPA: hypothetical protein DGC56_06025 [Alistipes putredinis]|nr:hypothetical protein [Alistipes sp.]MBE5687984.1 hypothetical protein [Alistipes sp.]MBE5689784.1 hypothetical protein [Alistipes sp.]MBE5689899.1 hypothetical protein [Alistipes sp.]HCV84543.1 hypothetical protein [Alistipes putredinis]
MIFVPLSSDSRNICTVFQPTNDNTKPI